MPEEYILGSTEENVHILTPEDAETFNLFMRVWMALESGGPSL